MIDTEALWRKAADLMMEKGALSAYEQFVHMPFYQETLRKIGKSQLLTIVARPIH
jgi:phosphoribosylpyrophosphate synthetase